jgi:alanine racemase
MTKFAAYVHIDREALRHNLNQLRRRAPHARIMVVVKGDAYGHGMMAVCRALTEADAFAVARIDEALRLREAGIQHPILVLEGVFQISDIELAYQHQLQLVVHDPFQLQLFKQVTLPQPIPVWMKIDTGMHRLGFRIENALAMYRELQACAAVQKPLVLMSHFACADAPPHALNQSQLVAFEQLCQQATEAKSMANSAALFHLDASHFDWVRIGLSVYGISASAIHSSEALNLKPVMTFYSSLIAVRPHKKGEPVGYGATWVAPHDTCLGVVAAGYADGYPRHAPSGTHVLVNRRVVPLVGRVSMDMITVDLGANATDKVGDEVILWGEGLPVEEIAEAAATIPYELVTKIMKRSVKYYR